ncbi:hypothetical protein LR48_Vigan272s005500 [Vigna angularis]|uniref:Uncharacterized protein n=1 Tax=Phaseolus angularis TaxID=3914 RepID=A0A0L9T7B5_PHAAN|nr:hypothetical protein LR48_Vigan272s005500 [Vigna angularis]
MGDSLGLQRISISVNGYGHPFVLQRMLISVNGYQHPLMGKRIWTCVSPSTDVDIRLTDLYIPFTCYKLLPYVPIYLARNVAAVVAHLPRRPNRRRRRELPIHLWVTLLFAFGTTTIDTSFFIRNTNRELAVALPP